MGEEIIATPHPAKILEINLKEVTKLILILSGLSDLKIENLSGIKIFLKKRALI